MRSYKEKSFGRKLTWMNMLVCATALVLACAAFIGYDKVTFRDVTVRNLSTQAQIIGANSASALLFNDSQQAEKTLSALSAAHNISAAEVFGADGKPFATYARGQASAPPSLPVIPPGQTEIHWVQKDSIVLIRAITFEGQRAGTVYLRSDVTELTRRFERYAGIAGMVLLICMAAALGMSSIFRKTVAQPIVELAKTARAVSRDKNYCVRAYQPNTTGELAVLITAFNEMLEQIQRNEEALLKAHDELEERVRVRTAELQAAKKKVEDFSASIVKANEELERAGKFKDQFLSTMSHELRTPLNAVLGFSELLTEERYGTLNERQQRFLKHIHTGGKHLLSLINDILDLSKIEAGRLELSIETVPVKRTFAEVLDTMRPLADKKSQILSQRAQPEITVLADPTRFKQILMNLIANAVKFTPEGGTIELQADQSADGIRVGVRDSGPGIPPEEQKRIFEAFYRMGSTEKAVEGTGLGLAITRRLVELHGGQLGIESEVGHGSCFHFSLRHGEALKPAEPRGRNLAATVPMRGRVLVVEDDASAAQLLQSQLISAGYEVTLCDKPDRALDLAAQLQPIAVTLDVVMEPINGWDLLSSFKTDSRTAKIPVILVTIVDQPTKGALLSADEYIVKPVDKTTLLGAVERCISKRTRNGKASILVVEDDAPTREFVAELLSKQGCNVRTAGDGLEAAAQMDKATPDLVILDLMLPIGNGFELLAKWRGEPKTADLPIFILTSKDLNAQERDYLQTHSGVLFQKQRPWQDALLKQLERISATATPATSESPSTSALVAEQR
jgi:signal transduction histidine kinase/DNA-binding response OmpR family regulator